MSVAEAVSITRLEGSRWRFCGGRGGYGESNLTHCIKMGSTFWTKNNLCESQPLNHDAAYATAVKLSEARLLSMPTRSVRRKAASLCAEHVQQLGSESLLSDLMEVKD